MAGPVTLTALPIERQIYAKALLDMGLGIKRICKRMKMSPHTVIAIKRSQNYSAAMLEEFKRRLPFKSYKLADDIMDLVSREEIAGAPLGTKMVAYGIAIDKARDMEGSNRPVFNIVSVVNDAQATINRLNREMDSIRTVEPALQ